MPQNNLALTSSVTLARVSTLTPRHGIRSENNMPSDLPMRGWVNTRVAEALRPVNLTFCISDRIEVSGFVTAHRSKNAAEPRRRRYRAGCRPAIPPPCVPVLGGGKIDRFFILVEPCLELG